MAHKFERIVSIRQKRTDKARQIQRQCETAYANAEEDLSSISKEIENYAEEVRGLEVNLMSGLLKRRITQLDMARVREKLNETEDQARELNFKRGKALQALSSSKREMNLAREDTQFLTRKSEAIRKINERLQADLIEEQRYLNDKAEEDFMPSLTLGDRNVGF